MEISRSRQAVYRRPPTVEIRTHGRNTVAGVGGSGRENAPVHGPQGINTCVLAVLGAGGNCICPKRRFTTCWEWVHGGGGGRGRGDGQRPRLAGEELKRLDRLAEQVSLLPGVKCHRREMVHKMILGMGDAMCGLEGGDEGLRVLSSTLGRVVEGGDLDEEDDGYYSSSDEEGEVTDAMAARGVGEAGRVVVSPSIWNKVVPPDLLKVYQRAQKEKGEGGDSELGGRPGPVDKMPESLRVTTGGLHRTSAPRTARMFLTWKNALKCRAILDARRVNEGDPRRPPRFRLPALEDIRNWMCHTKRGVKRGRVFLAKLDLQNAYWSIHLPAAWRRIFVVQGASGRTAQLTVPPLPLLLLGSLVDLQEVGGDNLIPDRRRDHHPPRLPHSPGRHGICNFPFLVAAAIIPVILLV